MATRPSHTVSGPGVDRTSPYPLAALSLAQTLAARETVESTFYVRDPSGVALFHVTRDPAAKTIVTIDLRGATS